MQYIKVLINKKIQSLDHDFLYEVPSELWGLVDIGSAVVVPFGRQTEKGIVIGFADDPRDIQPKFIDGICNEGFFFPEDLLILADRLGKYYMSTTIGFIFLARCKKKKQNEFSFLFRMPETFSLCAVRSSEN